MDSHIRIVSYIDSAVKELSMLLPKHLVRIIRNEDESKDEFQIAHAHKATKEAYISSNEQKYILLCGKSFTVQAQNSLLKILEEPPANISFILVTTSKSSILPTIVSRMPLKYVKNHKEYKAIGLDMANMDLRDVYAFLKQNQRISKGEAKEIVESILVKCKTQNMNLSAKQLNSFSTAMKLLDLNSRPVNVLTSLLLSLLPSKKRIS